MYTAKDLGPVLLCNLGGLLHPGLDAGQVSLQDLELPGRGLGCCLGRGGQGLQGGLAGGQAGHLPLHLILGLGARVHLDFNCFESDSKLDGWMVLWIDR